MPTLRKKLDHGQAIGLVTLTDSLSHRRRDFYCGPWDSEQTRKRYAQLILQWEMSGRRRPCQDVSDGITVGEIIMRYWRWAETYYSASERTTIRDAWKVLESHSVDLAATSFGPIKLREVRELMIAKGWARKYINKQIHRLGAIFKWAAGEELIPITVYQSLKTIQPLKRGRCKAVETKDIQPVAIEHVNAVKPYVSRQVWAIIELQRLTGARPGELVPLRKQDIDRSAAIWRTTLAEHKTAHHGKIRTIYFGPLAQAVLSEWLMRPDDTYLFSPREAEHERIETGTQNRKTPANEGNTATGRRGGRICASTIRRPATGGRSSGRSCRRKYLIGIPTSFATRRRRKSGNILAWRQRRWFWDIRRRASQTPFTPSGIRTRLKPWLRPSDDKCLTFYLQTGEGIGGMIFTMRQQQLTLAGSRLQD